jgi:large subunit ribosomal protein L18
MRLKSRTDSRARRHLRLRQTIKGTELRPRMAVAVSNKHMYVQFVDDVNGRTIATVSTLTPGVDAPKNVDGARKLGQQAAVMAKSKGIETVVFDRGGRMFHGRVKAIADAARESGLRF